MNNPSITLTPPPLTPPPLTQEIFRDTACLIISMLWKLRCPVPASDLRLGVICEIVTASLTPSQQELLCFVTCEIPAEGRFWKLYEFTFHSRPRQELESTILRAVNKSEFHAEISEEIVERWNVLIKDIGQKIRVVLELINYPLCRCGDAQPHTFHYLRGLEVLDPGETFDASRFIMCFKNLRVLDMMDPEIQRLPEHQFSTQCYAVLRAVLEELEDENRRQIAAINQEIDGLIQGMQAL